jgi:hypothetical protein
MAFPVGRPDVEPKGGYPYRDTVMKQRGSSVATTLLEQHPVAKSLVGVFFAEWAIWNAPAQTGHDVVFIHNPFMNERVREDAFPFLREEISDVQRGESFTGAVDRVAPHAGT